MPISVRILTTHSQDDGLVAVHLNRGDWDYLVSIQPEEGYICHHYHRGDEWACWVTIIGSIYRVRAKPFESLLHHGLMEYITFRVEGAEERCLGKCRSLPPGLLPNRPSAASHQYSTYIADVTGHISGNYRIEKMKLDPRWDFLSVFEHAKSILPHLRWVAEKMRSKQCDGWEEGMDLLIG